MKKKFLIITLMALCFGLGVAAQPALAVECAQMVSCMSTHVQGHLPVSSDGYPCACGQTPVQFANSACSSSRSSMTALAVKWFPNIDHGLPTEYDHGWIAREKGNGSNYLASKFDPGPQCPTYILYQVLLN